MKGKGTRGKFLIWVACPAGVGSSTMIKLRTEEVLRDHGFHDLVEVESVSDSLAKTGGCDILLATMNIAKRFEKELNIPVVGMVNVMRDQEYEEKLIPIVKELTGQEEN